MSKWNLDPVCGEEMNLFFSAGNQTWIFWSRIYTLVDWQLPRSHPIKEFYLLSYDAVYSDESQTEDSREYIAPSSAFRSKPSKKPAFCLLHGGLLFDLEDGDTFLRNVGWLSSDYTMLYPRPLLLPHELTAM
jgi:hypothetical protein